MSLDAFCAGTADARPRRTATAAATTVGALADAEPMLALPAAPYPATVIVSRHGRRERGGGVPRQLLLGAARAWPAAAGRNAGTGWAPARWRSHSAAGVLLAAHRLAPDGAGILVRTAGPPRRAGTGRARRRSPPTGRASARATTRPATAARAEAALLLAGLGPDVTVDLADWAELAEVTR